MAKKKNFSPIKKIIVVGLILIVIQGVYLLVFGAKSKPVDIRQAIEKAVAEKKGLTPQRREQARIQLALADYLVKKGMLPPTLEDLVPEYFDVLPNDPSSGQPFHYRIEGKRYFLGDQNTVAMASNQPLPNSSGLTPEEEQKALIESLNEGAEKASFVYDSTGKRDPFRPFDLSPKSEDDNKTPLERYSIGQLKLTAVLAGFDEPTAIIENAIGKGFTVKKGTKVGPNGGEIVEILADKILILETEIDFTGLAKTRTLELKLRTKEKESP